MLSGRGGGNAGGLKEGPGERRGKVGSSIGCGVLLGTRVMNKCLRGKSDGIYRFRARESPTPARPDRQGDTLRQVRCARYMCHPFLVATQRRSGDNRAWIQTRVVREVGNSDDSKSQSALFWTRRASSRQSYRYLHMVISIHEPNNAHNEGVNARSLTPSTSHPAQFPLTPSSSSYSPTS